MKLKPYQQELLDDLIQRDPWKGMLRLDTRLGKSVVSIRLCAELKLSPVLIICPAQLIPTWQKTIKEWDYNNDIKQLAVKSYMSFSTRKFTVRKGLTIIIDESHMLNNPTTKRSRHIIKHIKAAERVLFLTATPLISGIKNIYLFAKCMELVGRQTYTEFTKQYSLVRENKYRYSGVEYYGTDKKAIKPLKKKLRPHVIKLTKEMVGMQLPPKTVDKIYFDVDIPKIEEDILVELLAAMERGELIIEGTELKSARVLLALAKVNYAAEFILGMTGKTVVFTWHKEIVESLAEAFLKRSVNAVCITGDVALKQRTKLINLFKTSNKVNVLICTMASTSVGQDFKEADSAVFVELPYTPAMLLQAESRIENLERKKPINIFHLLANHKLDKRVSEILEEKREGIKV